MFILKLWFGSLRCTKYHICLLNFFPKPSSLRFFLFHSTFVSNPLFRKRDLSRMARQCASESFLWFKKRSFFEDSKSLTFGSSSLSFFSCRSMSAQRGEILRVLMLSASRVSSTRRCTSAYLDRDSSFLKSKSVIFIPGHGTSRAEDCIQFWHKVNHS